MILCSLVDVDVRRAGRHVLRNVTLSIAEGEIVTIVGPNGSGKTTLLQIVLGALQPSRGEVHRADGLKIGYLPQKLTLPQSLPMTARRFLGLRHGPATTEITAALDRVGATSWADRQMTQLSGGQLQRVLLARALLDRPQLLVLDEPTTGLDQAGSAAFYRLLADLRDSTGCAILMVSHELHVVMSASDRVICLNGHVCCEGTPQVVSAAPQYRALFGSQTQGALALYRHDHDHRHDQMPGHGEDHDCAHDHADRTAPAP